VPGAPCARAERRNNAEGSPGGWHASNHIETSRAERSLPDVLLASATAWRSRKAHRPRAFSGAPAYRIDERECPEMKWIANYTVLFFEAPDETVELIRRRP